MQQNSNNQSPPSPPHTSTPPPPSLSQPSPLNTNASSSSQKPPSAMCVPVLPPPPLSTLTTSSQLTSANTSSRISLVSGSGRAPRASSRHKAIPRSLSGPATTSLTPPRPSRQSHHTTTTKKRATAGKWVVEKIIDQATTASGTIYHVKWKGPYDSTWEVYDNVKDCEALEIWQQHRSRLIQVASTSQVPNPRRALPTQCPLCTRTFNHGKGLVAHLNTNHTPIPLHIISSLSLLPCPHCKHFYQSLQSHQRHCTADHPAVHSFRSNPPQQQPHTSLADAFAATSHIHEHKAERDNKEEIPPTSSTVYIQHEQKTEKENKQNHRYSTLLPPIPDLPVSEFASEAHPPCSPPTHTTPSSPHTDTPVLHTFDNTPVCCICQSSNSIIDDTTETFPLPCCQNPVHLSCVIAQSQNASTCPTCRIDLAHRQLHPSFTMPPTLQRVNETYANDMSMDEISRIQNEQQNEHQGIDDATLELLRTMLNDDASLPSFPLVDVQLPQQVQVQVLIPPESTSSPRRVSFDLSSNTLHVHTNIELIDNNSINEGQHEYKFSDVLYPEHDASAENVEFNITLNNAHDSSHNNPPHPLPSSSLPCQLPSQYSTIPHLWKTIPKSATSSWAGVGRTLLQQALSAEKEGNLDKRDELFVQFMLLPRRYLNRVAKQRNAARQLAKHLHHQHSSLSQPQQTQTSLHSHQHVQQQQV